MFFVFRLLTSLCLIYLGALSSHGQLSEFAAREKQSRALEIVQTDALLSVDTVQSASTFQVAIIMNFEEGWHANANPAGENLIPTEVILSEHTDLKFGEVIYPAGEELDIASIGKAPVYHRQTIIGFQATVADSAHIQKTNLLLSLIYQACSNEKCLLPVTIDIAIPIEVVGNDQPVQRINDAIFENLQFGTLPDRSAPPTSATSDFLQALSKGYLWAFLFVFVGGILTSLTPCVYPLIPITVSVFGASASAGRTKAFFLSVTYVLGIAVMYSVLGVVVASTGAVFGQLMANPLVVGIISATLIALGLSLLGVFEFRLSYVVQNRLKTVGGTGFGGAFAMGTVAGSIAAPCTGPALGAVLSYVATTGSSFIGFWLMLTYALGMGLLFIVIGTFSGIISSLPRSGAWMYVLENILGIVVIATALYFLKEVVEPLRRFLDSSFQLFFIGAVLVLVGIFLGHLTHRFRDLPRRAQFRKSFGILSAVTGLYVIIGGFTAVENQLDWIHDETQGLALAHNNEQPVIIDFYATWCGACVELDKYTFSAPKVASRLSHFVKIKLDFSRSSEQVEQLKEKYGIVGLPVVLFLDTTGKPFKRLEKFVGPEEFLEILDKMERS